MAAADLGLRGALHDAGQFWRAHAEQRKAHAGLLVHRACRIPAGGFCREQRNWHLRRHLLYRSLCRHERGSVRGGQPFCRRRGALRLHRRLLRAGRRSPLLAFTLTIFMLSLIGIPTTAGFLGKYYVFTAALSTHAQSLVWLTIIGLVNRRVASYYYLRLIVVMYMREPVVAEAPPPASAA